MAIFSTAHHAGWARLRACALAACAALLLAACGDKQPAQQAQQPSAQTPPGAAPVQPASPAPAPAVAQMPVPELLKNATLAVAEERLVVPPGNNAIEYYLAVTAQEPNNVQATQALVDLFPMTASIAERAIEKKELDEADRIVAMLDKASPGSYTVSTIRTKLDAARQAIVREDERKLATEAQAAQRAAELAAKPATPEPAPEPAAPTPRPTPAAAAPEAATNVASATPPPAQTAPPTPPPAAGGETRDAQLLKAVQPQYPTDAARKRLDGWVEVQFTIGVDGKVSNVSVARSQPARVFDREAIRAMQQWTFKAAQKNGQPIESRRKQRMEFKLGE